MRESTKKLYRTVAELGATRAMMAVTSHFDVRWNDAKPVLEEVLVEWMEQELRKAYDDGQKDYQLDELLKMIEK